MTATTRTRVARLAAGFALAAAGTAAAATVHEVVIEGMKFNPPALEVKAGDTVVWTNKDMVPHNATADDGAFRSDDLQPGQSWHFRAGQAGSFPYFCSLHPTMKAILTVK